MNEAPEAPAQWNVIIDSSARDYQRFKQIERQKDQLRKIAYKQMQRQFRNALDENLQEKRMLAHDDKEEDRRMFESMISKNRRLDQLEEQKKQAIQQRLKDITGQNKKRIDEGLSNSVLQREAVQTLTSIAIGNPEEDNHRRLANKKELLDFYSQHMQEKREREEKEKQRDRQLQRAQREILERQEQQRLQERQRILSHGQNQDIYRYYNSLNELGMRKEHELSTRMVEQAAQYNREKQEQRIQQDTLNRQRKLEDVKKSLLEQMNRNREARQQLERERSSYTEINKIAEGELSNRGQTYNKDDYLAFLMKQEELHKRRKSEEKGMSSKEYQLNLHDLQTAVRGQSVHNASPLYIGYGGQQEQRKDQIYFKLPPQSSSRTNRATVIPEDSLDQYQRRLNQNIVQHLKP